MVNTSTNWVQLSDVAIVKQIGSYLKHVRLQQNKTQVQLAENAGLNRWTLSQIEKGESITLMSLIQILRALDHLHVLNSFVFSEEISPLEYAKLKKQKRQRASSKKSQLPDKEDLGW